MNDTIEMVAFPAHGLIERGACERRDPIGIGVVGRGILRVDFMQAEKEEDQGHRDARAGTTAPCRREPRDEGEDQGIFEQPVVAIKRTDRERDPDHGEEPGEHQPDENGRQEVGRQQRKRQLRIQGLLRLQQHARRQSHGDAYG